jgi:hypothetical protein
MGEYRKEDLDLDTATYYAEKGKLVHLNDRDGAEARHLRCSALGLACEKGYSVIVKCLLAAGAHTEKAVGIVYSLDTGL